MCFNWIWAPVCLSLVMCLLSVFGLYRPTNNMYARVPSHTAILLQGVFIISSGIIGWGIFKSGMALHPDREPAMKTRHLVKKDKRGIEK